MIILPKYIEAEHFQNKVQLVICIQMCRVHSPHIRFKLNRHFFLLKSANNFKSCHFLSVISFEIVIENGGVCTFLFFCYHKLYLKCHHLSGTYKNNAAYNDVFNKLNL